MTNKEIFIQMRELLKEKENWTQRAAARDINGFSCYPEEKEAFSFCLVGAAEKVISILSEKPRTETRIKINEILRKFIPTKEYNSITKFNDDKNTTHEDIIKLLDKIINSLND